MDRVSLTSFTMNNHTIKITACEYVTRGGRGVGFYYSHFVDPIIVHVVSENNYKNVYEDIRTNPVSIRTSVLYKQSYFVSFVG